MKGDSLYLLGLVNSLRNSKMNKQKCLNIIEKELSDKQAIETAIANKQEDVKLLIKSYDKTIHKKQITKQQADLIMEGWKEDE